MDQILGIGRYQTKTKPHKNWGFQHGIPFKQGPPKFKLFNFLSWTHEIFKVSKHKGKIKFDQILEPTTMGGPSQTRPPKFKTF